MPDGSGGKLDRRVVRASEAALAQRNFVTAIDVLMGLGWLEPRRVDEWRQGRIPYLEAVVIASLGKISTAMKVFRDWAQARGLKPSETAYVARTRDRRPLRFSKSGDPGIERTYRTHWVSPELSERKRERLAERQSRQLAPKLDTSSASSAASPPSRPAPGGRLETIAMPSVLLLGRANRGGAATSIAPASMHRSFWQRSDDPPPLGPSLVNQSSDEVDAGTAAIALLKPDTIGHDDVGDDPRGSPRGRRPRRRYRSTPPAAMSRRPFASPANGGSSSRVQRATCRGVPRHGAVLLPT